MQRPLFALTLVLAAVAFLAPADPLRAAKTDVVTFPNGDRLTGEVKGLERGELAFKTGATGTIKIEWDEVASVRGSETFQVETRTGERYFGSLAPAGEGELEVVGEEKSWILERLSVVYMEEIEKGFWKRLDGELDLGFSFTEADDRLQLSFGAEASYRTKKYLRTLSFNAIQTSQDEIDDTSRQDLDLQMIRDLRQPRRVLVTLASLQRNDELDLDLRALAGVAAGWFAVQTNTELLNLFAGGVFTSEDVAGAEDDQESIEAVLGLGFQSFRYDTPERDLDIRLAVFPSLSESGRVRAELKAKISWEIVEDFTFGLTLLESYDSDPATEGAEQTDLSLVSSLGWSF